MRVRDLVDMLLLVRCGLDGQRVRDALEAVFRRRKTHALPQRLPAPPDTWIGPFSAMASECSLNVDLLGAFDEVVRFVAELR